MFDDIDDLLYTLVLNPLLHCPLGNLLHLDDRKGLFDAVKRPFAHRFEHKVFVPACRDHDHLDSVGQALYPLEKLNARHAFHEHIKEYDVDIPVIFLDQLDRHMRVVKNVDVKVALKNPLEGLDTSLLIVDDHR